MFLQSTSGPVNQGIHWLSLLSAQGPGRAWLPAFSEFYPRAHLPASPFSLDCLAPHGPLGCREVRMVGGQKAKSQHEAACLDSLPHSTLGSAHISASSHPFLQPWVFRNRSTKVSQYPESPKILHRSSTCHLALFLIPSRAPMGLAARPSLPYITVAGRSSQQCQMLPPPTQGDLPGRAALPLGLGQVPRPRHFKVCRLEEVSLI